MTEPCMFPNLHEPFYCRIHADVRLRLTDERCRRGVTLTQPQPDAVPDVVACRPCLDTMNASHPGGWNAPHVASHPHDGHAYDGCKCVCCLNVRAIRSTPAAPKGDDRE